MNIGQGHYFALGAGVDIDTTVNPDTGETLGPANALLVVGAGVLSVEWDGHPGVAATWSVTDGQSFSPVAVTKILAASTATGVLVRW